MLRDRNIVCVSTIDWDFLWQEHQGVMSVLARAGNRVLFIGRGPSIRGSALISGLRVGLTSDY
jgi:hypothetical protein